MRSALFFMVFLLLVGGSFAQTKKGDEMSQTELMEYGMKIMNPGEEHQLLQKFEGNWLRETKVEMEPGTPPMNLKSESSGELILGGRFVEVNALGNFMGMKFESKQVIGHDNRQGVYTYYGIDGMGTYAVEAKGTYDAESKTLTLFGEEDDPIFYAPRKFKMIFRFIDEDHREFEHWFLTNEKGEEEPVQVISSKLSRIPAAKDGDK